MGNYIEKRWSKEVMEKRLENLKKVLPACWVNSAILEAKDKTESELDALYIAYYDLKDTFCKIKRGSFGKPKQVGYIPKKKPIGYYSNMWDIYDDDDDWSWIIRNNSASATSSGIYTYNASDAWNTYSTTTISLLNR